MRGSAMLVALPLLLAACQGADDAAPADDGATEAAATDAAGAQPAAGEGDALVAGTDYNATTILTCSFDGVAPADGCPAGVKRQWSEDGGALIEVSKPDGMKRAIFTDAAGVPFGADSAEADGSAAWDFTVTRQGDTSIIDFGPEHYEIPDAVVLGG